VSFKYSRMDHKTPRSIGIAPSDDITTYCYPEMNATETGTASNCNSFSYVMLDAAYNGMIPLTLLNLVDLPSIYLLHWTS
jgi:hypothetical protein